MAGPVTSKSEVAQAAVGWHSRAESFGQSPSASKVPHLPFLKEEEEGDLAPPERKADGNSGATDSTLVDSISAIPSRIFPNEPRFAEASPSPLTPGDAADYQSAKPLRTGALRSSAQSAPPHQAVPANSAPPILGKAHNPISYDSVPKGADTLDSRMRDRMASASTTEPLQTTSKFTSSHSFNLDPEAAVKAVREPGAGSVGASESEPAFAVLSPEDGTAAPAAPAEPKKGDEDDWGLPFKIEWVRTTRLPFHRTRNLRNPWNHDREVKVSRDGTELEPTVGQRLLDEWDRPEGGTPPPPPPPSMGRRGRGRGGGPRAAPALDGVVDHIAS